MCFVYYHTQSIINRPKLKRQFNVQNKYNYYITGFRWNLKFSCVNLNHVPNLTGCFCRILTHLVGVHNTD